MTTSTQSNARTNRRLRSRSDWHSLLSGEVDAIHVESFASNSECSELIAFFEAHPRTVPYIYRPKAIRLGASFSDARKSNSIKSEYAQPDVLEEALELNSAIARLIGTVSSSWPHGVVTYCYSGIPLHRLVARRFVFRGQLPHQDSIALALPDDAIATSVKRQIGVNIYVQMPESGGLLEGWHVCLSKDEYNRIRYTEPDLRYGVRRNELHDPDWSIMPSVGDLILFVSSELHAIPDFSGVRTTYGFFIGYVDDASPLFIWS